MIDPVQILVGFVAGLIFMRVWVLHVWQYRAPDKRVTDSNRQETEMTPRESDVMHHALRESVEIVDD